jgi:hypothetical protein
MSPTLLEGAIALFLVWIAWRIGVLLSPWVIRKFRSNNPKSTDQKDPPSKIIDV